MSDDRPNDQPPPRDAMGAGAAGCPVDPARAAAAALDRLDTAVAVRPDHRLVAGAASAADASPPIRRQRRRLRQRPQVRVRSCRRRRSAGRRRPRPRRRSRPV